IHHTTNRESPYVLHPQKISILSIQPLSSDLPFRLHLNHGKSLVQKPILGLNYLVRPSPKRHIRFEPCGRTINFHLLGNDLSSFVHVDHCTNTQLPDIFSKHQNQSDKSIFHTNQFHHQPLKSHFPLSAFYT